MENIRLSLNRHYLNADKASIVHAHSQLLKEFYTDFNHETGKPQLKAQYPLLATYRYWADKLIDVKEKNRNDWVQPIMKKTTALY